MGSDNQWTAIGPAIVGFQTNSASIDRGAEISGNTLGILGHCDRGNGVHGQSASPTDSGVWGENNGGGVGVSGSSHGFGVFGSADGVGVSGSSVAGYGGQFTGGFAQLYLTPSTTTGHPTNDTHNQGEFYVDSNGSLFFCKTTGVPGTWVKLA